MKTFLVAIKSLNSWVSAMRSHSVLLVSNRASDCSMDPPNTYDAAVVQRILKLVAKRRAGADSRLRLHAGTAPGGPRTVAGYLRRAPMSSGTILTLKADMNAD